MDNINKERSGNLFTWNDSVIISEKALQQFHPGEVGVICGISRIEDNETASKYHAEVGEWMYTVELANGKDVFIPEFYLDFHLNALKYSWGDVVIVKKEIIGCIQAGEKGSISGFFKINENSLAEEFNKQIGDWLYIIKFENGKEIMLSEDYIE